MAIELRVPSVGESITSVEIGDWLKAVGDLVTQDENVVVLDSDKATVELPAPAAGRLSKIVKHKGETAAVGEVIGEIDERADAGQDKPQPPAQKPPPAAKRPRAAPSQPESKTPPAAAPTPLAPSAPAVVAAPVPAPATAPVAAPPAAPDMAPAPAPATPASAAAPEPVHLPATNERMEQVVHMSLWRRTIAKRLVQAGHEAALLTTFNEIDMTAVKNLRSSYGDTFQKKHGVRLGLMSFFVKASVDALHAFPEINAEVRGEDIVFRNYCDIGIAVSTGRGLVVPVLHGADRLSFAEVEKGIAEFARRAEAGQLTPEELEGGTFTITNGGVFGSLSSTPIVNPPQSAILGMHAIKDRPVALDGQVVIRPMMNVALTYDHRIIDGREAVLFLARVRDAIEDPVRMLIET
jgi:2-oxoglutarate dehydrogenase E2 component (dihydrolipoamide succinyltransferase)